MIKSILIPQLDTINFMCAVCVSDRSGGQIALLIIISALIFLGLANWAWKKYFKNTREISTEE